MQRTVNRVYRRLRGQHPRRPPSTAGRVLGLVFDGVLALALVAVLSGFCLIVIGPDVRSSIEISAIGLAILLFGFALLLLWERLAWGPFSNAVPETRANSSKSLAR